MLECTDKFRDGNGKFYILLDDNVIVGCSGVYLSGFDFHVAIAGVRTWINKGHRNMALLKKYFFPVQRQWAIEQECKQVALTFNDYNKSLIRIFRMNKYNRTETDLFYNGFNEVKFPTEIKNTKQWVVYENLNDNNSFDWSLIKWNK